MLFRFRLDWALGDDDCEFTCRLDDDWYFNLELGGYRSSNACCMLRWRSTRSAEDGVAAVEQGSHACVAQAGKQGTQLSHGNTLGVADIDATQKGYERGHLRRLTFDMRGGRQLAKPDVARPLDGRVSPQRVACTAGKGRLACATHGCSAACTRSRAHCPTCGAPALVVDALLAISR